MKHKTTAVPGAGPHPIQGFSVLFSRISLIALPGIGRIAVMKQHHEAVPVHFGQNRSRRNGYKVVIAPYEAMVRKVLIRAEAVAIDQKPLRPQGKLMQGLVHSGKRSLEDIELVDAGRRNMGYRPGTRFGLNTRCPGFPLAGGQLFAVAKSQVCGGIPPYDGRGGDRARQAAASCFITACLQAFCLPVGEKFHGARAF